MKNIVISKVPFSDLLDISAAGFIGAVLFWFVFTVLAALFPGYLGFPMTRGSEELAMEAAVLFYGIVAVPLGAVAGTLVALKSFGFKFKPIYIIFIASILVAIGLIFEENFSIFTFIFYAIISSFLLATISSIWQK